jgi:hypothetical protein
VRSTLRLRRRRSSSRRLTAVQSNPDRAYRWPISRVPSRGLVAEFTQVRP